MVPADTLVCDTAQIAVWQSDPAFAYSRELIAPEINVLEWFSRWFGKLLDKIFGNTLVAEYSEVVLICIAILILVLVIWFLYKKRPELFMHSRKSTLPYTVGEDTIYGVDFAEGIADALVRTDYREAVRLLYLQTLKFAERSGERRDGMKGNHWFIAGIIAFLVLMFAIECRLPKKFVWNPTFSHYDKQPFGCAVFDSLVSSSLPKGYSLSRKTFYELEQEDTTLRRGILVVTDNLHLTDVDVEAMLKMAGRGDRIMLAGSSFSRILKDTLGFECSYSYFSPSALKKYATALLSKDSLCWVGDSAVYPQQTFCFYPQLCQSYFFADSISCKVLAEKTVTGEAAHPVAMSVSWGKGEVILASTPLLFTNYGVLDGKNAAYLFRILSQMGGFPIVRTEGYMKETAQAQMSPFRYFLSQPPLRWALYLSMVSILLFMIFTARRKQRAIPVIREPENKSLEFAELIGTLYYQKKDHADLVRKKYLYFAEELRREMQVDVEEVAEDERSFGRIARKTGMEVEEIAKFIREVRPVIYGGRRINAEQMKVLIDKMNEIINHI